MIRSILISQRRLATREIILLRHTDCGMASFDDDQFVDQIEAEVGARPAFDMGAFDDVEGDLRRPMQQRSECHKGAHAGWEQSGGLAPDVHVWWRQLRGASAGGLYRVQADEE